MMTFRIQTTDMCSVVNVSVDKALVVTCLNISFVTQRLDETFLSFQSQELQNTQK